MSANDKDYRPLHFREEEPASDDVTAAETLADSEPTPEAEQPAETAGGAKPVAEADADAGAEQDEGASFDYIVPAVSYKKRRRRHKKHRHSTSDPGKTPAATPEEQEAAAEGYIFSVSNGGSRRSSKRHHRKRRLRRRIPIIILSVFLALILAAAGTYLVMREIGRRSMHQYDAINIVTPTEDESGNDVIAVDKNGRVITYDGVSYAFNNDIISLVCIGVDTGSDEYQDAYMADVIYIVAIDAKSGAVKILSVSRDTITDVDVYSDEGKYIDTEQQQLSYAYFYANDKVTGGQNVNASLSHLFFGLPMDNYFAINLDALTTLNDAIGGVTLTSSITFESPETGRTIYAGDTVTLHGQEAHFYVRMRDSERVDANNERMQRQQEYIRAFIASILPAAKKDISIISNLYGAITANSETTLDAPKITYIASTALSKLGSASDIEYLSLSGEITAGEHAEMHVKDEDVIRTMLDMFYTPIADVPDIP